MTGRHIVELAWTGAMEIWDHARNEYETHPDEISWSREKKAWEELKEIEDIIKSWPNDYE